MEILAPAAAQPIAAEPMPPAAAVASTAAVAVAVAADATHSVAVAADASTPAAVPSAAHAPIADVPMPPADTAKRLAGSGLNHAGTG